MSKPMIDIMNQKFILELNAALAMENAGIERLQTRIEEVSLPEAKQQLEHHLEESLEHQKILEQIITSIGGDTTQEKLGLPLPSYPVDMKAMMDKSMTKQEYELKRAEEDMILENAVYLNAIDPLSKNMQDEQNQAHWIKTNSPNMLAQLWPKIQSAVAASAPPFSL